MKCKCLLIKYTELRKENAAVELLKNVINYLQKQNISKGYEDDNAVIQHVLERAMLPSFENSFTESENLGVR